MGTNGFIEENAGVVIDQPLSNPPKVYRALLTQTGTDAPVATVLENTLGGTLVWTRDGAGIYTGTLAGAFPDVNKVFIPNNHFSSPNDGGTFIGIYYSSVDTITVEAGGDNQISSANYPLTLELRVYP